MDEPTWGSSRPAASSRGSRQTEIAFGPLPRDMRPAVERVATLNRAFGGPESRKNLRPIKETASGRHRVQDFIVQGRAAIGGPEGDFIRDGGDESDTAQAPAI